MTTLELNRQRQALFMEMEDHENWDLDEFEQEEVWSEVVSQFNSDHGSTYKLGSAIAQYKVWQRENVD